MILAMAACAPPSTPPQSESLSRDARSQNYCAHIGGVGTVYYDAERLLACRREEYTAGAAARDLPPLSPEAEARCDSEASFGNAPMYFSWVAFFDCVNTAEPLP
jgi:hypothetical protein